MMTHNDPFPGRLDSAEHVADPARSGVARGADMDPTIQELIERFHAAEKAVRREFEQLASPKSWDGPTLERLREAAHNLADQVDVLLASMTNWKVTDDLVDVAEEIFDSLRELEERIETMLKGDHGLK